MASLVVLVTGGSGFLGQHVVKHLHLYGDSVKEIRVLDVVPYKKKLDFTETKPVTSFVGSVINQDIVSQACQGVDAVLHVAAIIDSSMFPNYELLNEINVKGTETVLNASKEQNVRMFIYCSSISILQGFDEEKAGTETSIKVPTQLLQPAYSGTKTKAQRMVLSANGFQLKDGNILKTMAILPLTMYGELDNNLTKFLKEYKGKVFPRMGKMRGYVHFAYVGNVAAMFVRALESLHNNPDLGGEFFFGADDTPATPMPSLMKPFFDCIQGQVSSWYIPFWVAYSLLAFIYYILLVMRLFCNVNFPLNLGGLVAMNRTFYVTYDKAKTLLGYKPVYNYETSLERSLAFYSKI